MSQRTSPGLKKGKLNVLGPKIQMLRSKNGWTQLQFCLRLQRRGWDIKMSSLGRIETGDRSITDNELLFMAKVLGCSLADLESPKG